jgi:hypothetical protein
MPSALAPFRPATLGVVCAYAVLYSSYSKATKRLEPRLLADIVLFRRGWEFTLKEVNKVLALAGLTMLGAPDVMALLAQRSPPGLRHDGMRILMVHGLLSMNLYFDRLVQPAKRTAMWTGVLALFCGAIAYTEGLVPISPRLALLATVGLGTTHFYLMEKNERNKLVIRPFGFLALVVGVLSTGRLLERSLAML